MFPVSASYTEIRRDNLVQEKNEHLDNNVQQVATEEDEEKQQNDAEQQHNDTIVQATERDSHQGTRRSTRNRRLPVRFKDFVVEVDHELE